MLSVARRSAVKARTVAANQINSLIVTADEHLKDRLRGQRSAAVVVACARMPSGCTTDATSATAKLALGTLPRRHQALSAEINHLDTELLNPCAQANPALQGTLGVGADTATALLVAAGDNPTRIHTKRPSPRSARPAPSRRPQPPQCATASTAAPTAKPTTPCGASPSPDRASMNAPSPTPNAAAPNPTPHMRSCAASNATPHARPTSCSPTRPRSPNERTCADNEPDTDSPSTTQPKPSTPTPPASQNSNEASATTATSPNDTNNTSPKSRLAKHRSIYRIRALPYAGKPNWALLATLTPTQNAESQ